MRPLALGPAVALAVVAGFVFDAAFPDIGLWPLAPVGVASALVALRGRRTGGAFLVGLCFGLAFYLVHIQWATLFLGDVPWLALSTLEALFVAAGAVLIASAYRWRSLAIRRLLLGSCRDVPGRESHP
jgi:apolipoprotein N-acyltransferase